MNEQFLPTDPRAFLREELRVRKERRPYYSMRAFARDLDMSPSALCEFFSGRRGMSKERVFWLGPKIGLSQLQTDHFWDLVESQFAKNKKDRQAAKMRAVTRAKSDNSRISLEKFRFMAGWYHVALLELLGLEGVRLSNVEMASILDISESKVQEALIRLEGLGLIEKLASDEGFSYEVKEDVSVVGGEGTNQAIQMAHEQFLIMQSEAVKKKSIEDRESLSISVSLSNEDWDQARKEIQQSIINILTKYASTDKKVNQVACMAMQIIRLIPDVRGRDV